MKNLLLILFTTMLASMVVSCSFLKKNKKEQQTDSTSWSHYVKDQNVFIRLDTGRKSISDTASLKKSEQGVKVQKIITEQEKVETEYQNGIVAKTTTTKTKTTAVTDSSGQKQLEASFKKDVDSSGNSKIVATSKKEEKEKKESIQTTTSEKNKSHTSSSWVMWFLIILILIIILVGRKVYAVKKKIPFLMLGVLLSTVSFSQSDSSNTLRISAVPAGDKILLLFKSFQSCIATVEGELPGDTTFTIPPDGTVSGYFPLSIQGRTLRIRTRTKCNQEANSSWVKITVASHTVLPVKVLSFTAAPAYKSIKLFYKVEVTGGDYFDIEKSNDGHTWKTVTSLYSSFSETFQREFTDHYAAPGNNLYRIRMFTSGKVSYSRIVAVKMDTATGDYVLKNISGIILKKGALAEIEQELRRQPKGTYLVQSGEVTTKIGN